jgi:hypothetical protein
MNPETLRLACAWCGRHADAVGVYRGDPQPKVTGDDWTHGVCPPCKRALLVEVDRMHGRAA